MRDQRHQHLAAEAGDHRVRTTRPAPAVRRRRFPASPPTPATAAPPRQQRFALVGQQHVVGVALKRRSASFSSSARIFLLTAAGVTPSWRAAAEKFAPARRREEGRQQAVHVKGSDIVVDTFG